MGKVAKLVRMTLTTRIIVDGDARDSDIIKIAIPKFIDKVANECHENIDSIEDDFECPYDEKFD
jgi:hypothetical protein